MGALKYQKWKKQERERLFEENPYCPICNRKMAYLMPKEGDTHPSNMATIDHIYSRYSPERQEYDYRVRLICLRCNQLRSEFETVHLPIERLWALSLEPPKTIMKRKSRIRHLLRRAQITQMAMNLPGHTRLVPSSF